MVPVELAQLVVVGPALLAESRLAAFLLLAVEWRSDGGTMDAELGVLLLPLPELPRVTVSMPRSSSAFDAPPIGSFDLHRQHSLTPLLYCIALVLVRSSRDYEVNFECKSSGRKETGMEHSGRRIGTEWMMSTRV
jgi:hypothetical protein